MVRKEESMENSDLKKNIALLESMNDQLMAEIAYIDDLMKTIGFTEGLKTVKATAEELYDEKEGEE
jgi:hypothetical protein